MKKTIIATFIGSVLLAFNAFASPVNVNTADAGTLATELAGVGKVKAEAIVEYREAHGAFKSLEDLKAVDGIGEHTIAENKDDIRFKDVQK